MPVTSRGSLCAPAKGKILNLHHGLQGLKTAYAMTVNARHRRANGTQNPLIGKLESDASSIASRKSHCHRHEHVHVHVRDGISFSNARRRIKRSCSNKLEVLAGFLSLVIITLLLTHWMGLVSFFDTKFEYNSMEFQLDREFFEHPRDIPILVVGGTDGSGTRAFVDTLKSLGVLIVADDPHTFDIHASIMFKKLGWPQLILTVLEATKGSLDYQWSSLPGNTRSIIEREVRKLRLSLAAKYAENKRRIRLAEVMRNRQEPGKNGVSPRVVATDVAFAFKAPISMLVLPILTEFMGPIKFLHVVRDGRDIALSNNQSPVLKFYNATYPDYQNRSQRFQGDLYPVRGMQLWNDWNVQVHEWSQKVAHDKSNNTPSLEYLVMRSEDLIDPSTKFDSLHRLAAFVGSPLSQQELCCRAKSHTKDYGQSAVHSESTNNYAKHPEHYQQIGSKRIGRVSNMDYQQPDVDMINRFPFNQQRYQEEIDALHVELAAKERKIRALEEKLSHLAQHKEERRQLSEFRPKLVPSMFLKQLSSWQERVMTSGEDLQVGTLKKLLDFGGSLEIQYRDNAEALMSVVDLNEIKKTRKHLEKLIQQRIVQGKAGQLEFKEKAMAVHERYGKWKGQLENRADLSRWLHQEGKVGLNVFGYEPRKIWDYRLGRNATRFQCDDEIPCDMQ